MQFTPSGELLTAKPPRAPIGLKLRGNALWRQVVKVYILDVAELELLRELCRTVDHIDAIDVELVEQGLVVTGTRGQLPKANPLLPEMRESQKTLSRLVSELALPMPGETTGRRRSPQQKQAAHSRWNRKTA